MASWFDVALLGLIFNEKKKGGSTMFKAFNSFQLTTLFAAAPFGIEWVKSASFYGSSVLFWVLLVAYIVGFIGMCIAVYSAVDG